MGNIERDFLLSSYRPPRFVVQPKIYNRRVLDLPQGKSLHVSKSPCLKPCLRTKVGTNLKPNAYRLYSQLQIIGSKIKSETVQLPRSRITFLIDDTVEFTEYRYAALNFPNLCAEIGGALGLWLGLGIIQLFQEGLGIVRRLQVMFKETE